MSTLDQNYIDEGEMTNVNKQADIVWKKVNNFITYLNKASEKRQNQKKLTNQTNQINRTNKTNKTNSTS